MDGASRETHEYYRVGSNFEEIKENIRRLCQEKRERKLKTPHITLQFVVMKHNEHEVDEIIRLAGSLGVDSLNLKTVSLGSWVEIARKKQLAGVWLPSNEDFSRYEMRNEAPQLKLKPKVCGWLRQSVILWNGDVSMCCYDFNGELVVGNIFEEPFTRIWKSPKYKKIRKAVVKREPKLCQNCTATMEYGQTIHF
jgi:radical SAM protein with 4Fe4S-binding SPASM domain